MPAWAHFRSRARRDAPGKADEVWVAVHVDDVVEIAWTATFGERSELLAEQFCDGVAEHTHRPGAGRCRDARSVEAPGDRLGPRRR